MASLSAHLYWLPWLLTPIYWDQYCSTHSCHRPHGTWNMSTITTLRPRQNGRHFPDDIFNGIFMNENVLISLEISLKFVPRHLINNIPALVQIIAWHLPGDKPSSEPMVVSSLTHICVTRPQWVKSNQQQYPRLQATISYIYMYCEGYLIGWVCVNHDQ